MIRALKSGVSAMFGDAADGHAADLHLVAPDELAGFLQFQVVVGAAAAGEHEIGDDQHHDPRARRRRAAARRPAAAAARAAGGLAAGSRARAAAARRWVGRANRGHRLHLRSFARRSSRAAGAGVAAAPAPSIRAGRGCAGPVGHRRGRGSAGDRRVGDLAQPRDQLDPLASASAPSRTPRRHVRRPRSAGLKRRERRRARSTWRACSSRRG